MKIVYFKIENFRNIRNAESTSPPDFLVICGANGCGKSALLQALMTAKENAAPYGGFNADPRAVSADADEARIRMTVKFSEMERKWYKEKQGADCPELDDVIIVIEKSGRARATKKSVYTRYLLSWYSREFQNSPGFFDYFDAYRFHKKKDLSTWDASSLNDSRIKRSLGARGQEKFDHTKEYLASLVFNDLQKIQSARREGRDVSPDSLKPIRDFFDGFFAPMEFLDVQIDTSPFKFIIGTPNGQIDIDDMSAGEKEVLNTYIRFHQLAPRDAVILFDEADAHLHPDLARRYLEVLREVGRENQIWLTTHSPEMMIEAGFDSLFTILKEPPPDGGNQFVQVTSTADLHESLSELMGSRGLVSFNQRIVFIEGAEASADRLVYERFYPPGQYNISFVPAGDSRSVRRIGERVNDLLTSGIGFQQFYSIVDGDIDRAVDDPNTGRLFRLPVYHVENFLLDEKAIFTVTSELLASRCPYKQESEITEDLHQLLTEDTHLNPFSRAMMDARISLFAKEAYNAVYQGQKNDTGEWHRPNFEETKEEAVRYLQDAIPDVSWKSKCKGRDLLKSFCHKHDINYEHFRNLVIARLTEPPEGLKLIMDEILG